MTNWNGVEVGLEGEVSINSKGGAPKPITQVTW